jgi:hypothetical protein
VDPESRFTVLKTIQTSTDGGMLQGLPLSILDALQSQPPIHFGYENEENFLDL